MVPLSLTVRVIPVLVLFCTKVAQDLPFFVIVRIGCDHLVNRSRQGHPVSLAQTGKVRQARSWGLCCGGRPDPTRHHLPRPHCLSLHPGEISFSLGGWHGSRDVVKVGEHRRFALRPDVRSLGESPRDFRGDHIRSGQKSPELRILCVNPAAHLHALWPIGFV
jgi:hypothetical protein